MVLDGAMSLLASTGSNRRLYLSAFVAGLIAVLVFNQGMLTVLHAAGLTPAQPFSIQSTSPLHLRQIWSYSFWGGVWGIVLALVAPRFPKGAAYWIAAFLFGAIFPTLVQWFMVLPLKGLPMGNGFPAAAFVIGPAVNGAWGLGTAPILHWRT
jgi:hypothetical protein